MPRVTFAELALRNAHSDLEFELESRELARKRAREQQRERLRREYEKRAEERRWQVYEELHAWLMDLFDGAVASASCAAGRVQLDRRALGLYIRGCVGVNTRTLFTVTRDSNL